MLPKNRLGARCSTSSRSTPAPTHPHHAQKPEALDLAARPSLRVAESTQEHHHDQRHSSRPPAAASVPSPASGFVPAPARSPSTAATLEDYFPSDTHRMMPHRAAASSPRPTEAYDIDATLHGGGPTGQAGAIRLGIARALDRARPRVAGRTLKAAGFLTRDSREEGIARSTASRRPARLRSTPSADASAGCFVSSAPTASAASPTTNSLPSTRWRSAGAAVARASADDGGSSVATPRAAGTMLEAALGRRA